MPSNAYLDILYTSAPVAPHPLQTFDIFVPHNGATGTGAGGSNRAPLICFVHGGAWRS